MGRRGHAQGVAVQLQECVVGGETAGGVGGFGGLAGFVVTPQNIAAGEVDRAEDATGVDVGAAVDVVKVVGLDPEDDGTSEAAVGVYCRALPPSMPTARELSEL